jgi:hypothetical protein
VGLGLGTSVANLACDVECGLVGPHPVLIVTA